MNQKAMDTGESAASGSTDARPGGAVTRGPASTTDAVAEALAAGQGSVGGRASPQGARKPVPHPSGLEREKAGRLARARTPRELMAWWHPGADRADPVALLEGQEASRVQELVPVRHARMASGAFAFYRGGALLMAADLATTARSGLEVQLCGDAHLSNFGLFAAPDRSVIFDVNDFDETNPGPFEWDVKRLATSFLLAARDNGLPDDVGLGAVADTCASYRESMARFAQMDELAIWYDRIDTSDLVDSLRKFEEARGTWPPRKKKAKKEAKKEAKFSRKVQVALDAAMAKARSRDAWSVIDKITEVVDGRRRFRDRPPLLIRLDLDGEATTLLNVLFREYRATLQEDRQALLKRYEIVDFGHKVVGVGSVGLLAFVLLLRGRGENDLLVLQVKQAQESVLEAFTHKSAYSKHGHRVVTGQRLMQAAGDSFLGWIDGPAGHSYYVRQLRDMKWSPDPATLDAKRLRPFAVMCGHTLARAHARSGDAVAIASYLGSGPAFDKAVTTFSTAYARQVEQDYAEFQVAIADERLASHEDAAGSEGKQALTRMSKPPPRKRPPT
jgi:uncharacterized protein (DUF2252 family)